jgi:histone H3/H4
MVEKRAFSLYDMEQFIKEAGAEKVTEDAVRVLEKEIEKLASTIAKNAMVYAGHAGRRKLIRSSDVILANDSDADYYRKPNTLRSSARTTKAASNATR